MPVHYKYILKPETKRKLLAVSFYSGLLAVSFYLLVRGVLHKLKNFAILCFKHALFDITISPLCVNGVSKETFTPYIHIILFHVFNGGQHKKPFFALLLECLEQYRLRYLNVYNTITTICMLLINTKRYNLLMTENHEKIIT